MTARQADNRSVSLRLIQTAAGLCLSLFGLFPAAGQENPLSADRTAPLFSQAFLIDIPAEQPEKSAPDADAVVRGNFTDLEINNPYKWRAVGQIEGEWGNFDAKSGNRSFSTGIFTSSFGADRKIGQNVLAGIHFGAASISADSDDHQTTAGVSSFSGLAHLGLFGGLWYWNLSCGVGQNRNRDWNPAFGEQFKFNQTQWTYATELGVKIRSGYTKIEPFIGFRYINLTEGDKDLKEKTRLFSDDSGQSYRTFLGSRFSWDYATYVARLHPSIWGMWAHEFGDSTLFSAGDLTEMPVLWRFADQRMPRDRAIIGGGIDAALRNKVDLWLHYNSDFSGRYQSHSLCGGVNIKY